jgi:metal-dependent amidase/aminoacylase/carboxypeptidase family protein
MTQTKQPTEILLNLDAMLPELEAVYKDIHAHPELSMQETRTAGIAADHLKASGFEVSTGVGKTGVVGAEWQAPAVFWFFGGDDPEVYAKAQKDGTLNELPTNHNPRFAPVIHPTLETGVKALVVAAHAWLAS